MREATIIGVLGTTQIIGWGTTYFLPAILHPQLSAATGLPKTGIFAGVTTMILVAAIAGVWTGRLLDRHGARGGLVAGSLLLAVGLVALAAATGPTLYFVAWALFGLGMPLTLSTGAYAFLAQRHGTGARRPISLLMLFAVLAQTVFWPLTLWLDGLLGWRNLCLLYAGLNVVALGLHARLPVKAANTFASSATAVPTAGLVPEPRRKLAVVLLVLAISLSGFVSWGLDLHLVTVLMSFGLSQATAVGAGAARGPVSLAARLADLLASGRLSGVGVAAGACAMTLAALLVALFGGAGLVSAGAFLVLMAAGTGIMAVARNTLPLQLFGAGGYATLLGRIGLPTQIIFATAPPAFAWGMEQGGVSAVLAFSAFCMAGAVAALLCLGRLCDPPRARGTTGT